MFGGEGSSGSKIGEGGACRLLAEGARYAADPVRWLWIVSLVVNIRHMIRV